MIQSLLTGSYERKTNQKQVKQRVSEQIKIEFPKIENERKETDVYLQPVASALQTYIYPKDITRREYQSDAVLQCLKENTIVCLPTGSGKTLIAAAIIMNYHRWFPNGMILFLTPTRTLLDQQSKFCLSFETIPQNESCVLTGSERLAEVWQNANIFFSTPQIVENDLKNGTIDPTRIVLVIFDEVHHARGHHSYSEIVEKIVSRNKFVRFVGLTATPGPTKQAIQEVVCKTLASNIFYIDEKDERLISFRHKTIMESIDIKNNDNEALSKLNSLIEKVANPLRAKGLITAKEITRGGVWIAMLNKKDYSNNDIIGNLLSLTSIAEKVNRYGISFLEKGLNEFEKRKNGALIMKMEEYQELKAIAANKSSIVSNKIIKLREILDDYYEHFPVGKTIIFAQYRDAVESIVTEINKFPFVKASAFIGKINGVNDTIQKSTLKAFSSGETNVLVSTCIGEEGIDIDDVGLIICFDAMSSPIRSIQRMGRTGRHCQGRCITFVSEGQEKKAFLKSKYNNKNMSLILSNTKWLTFYKSDKFLEDDIKCVCICCLNQSSNAENEGNEPLRGKAFLSKRKMKEMKQIFGMNLFYKPLALKSSQPPCKCHLFGKSAASRILSPLNEVFAISDYDSQSETSSESEETSENHRNMLFFSANSSDNDELNDPMKNQKFGTDDSGIASPSLGGNQCNMINLFTDDDDFDF